MRLSFTRRRRTRATRSRTAISGLSLAVVVSGLIVLAVRADGTPIADVDLNDGSVWVTSASRQLTGRLNAQIKQLDLGIQSPSADFDVLQEASTVFLVVRSGGASLRRVDVAAGRAGDPILLTPTSKVAFGGGVVAILDRDNGNAWVRSEQTVQGFTPELEVDLNVGKDADVAVGEDGTAWFVNRSRHTVTPVRVEAGLAVVGDPQDLGATLSDAFCGTATSPCVTVVGDSPVVLDRASGTLLQPGAEPVHVESTDPGSTQLQQPGPEADSVVLATRSALLSAAVGGGELTTIKDGFDGPPAAPLVHSGYIHAAWADPTAPAYIRLHGTDVRAEKIPQLSSNANLAFRRNRDVVVLNDLLNGTTWMVQEQGLPTVDNWDDVDPNVEKDQPEDPKNTQIVKPKCEGENHAPVARDDTLGARPGEDTRLPLIRNDSDPDPCDILTITSVDDIKWISGPKPQRMAIVGEGTELQVQFGPNATGEAIFGYTASDGRQGGTADAQARVTLVPVGSNPHKPELISDNGVPRDTAVTVARGQSTTIYALPDWADLDGDSLVLQSASTKSAATVGFRSDGVIQYADDGKVGTKVIDIEVSDGHPNGVTAAKILVTVREDDGVPPALLPDHVQGPVDAWISVAPLRNDFSRDGTDLHLRDVPAHAGLDIKQDPTTGTFQVRSSHAATYYLPYSAYTDRAESKSWIRLDVSPKSEENLPPVATKDDALVPAGGHALVDLLANDYDPEGDVLSVTSVTAPPRSGVKASLIQNHLLRIETVRDLSAPVILNYTVTDGPNQANGTIAVSQGKVSTVNRPPVAQDDRVTVRVGAVTTIAVLDNDFDPDGDDLQVFQQDLVRPDDLAVTVSGSKLRLKAPDVAGQYKMTYAVRDVRGQRDDAQVLIDVKADDAADNAAPHPKPVEARAIGNQPVRISLGLAGSDPDGDAVSLVGLTSAPSLGRVVRTGLDWLSYQPFDDVTTGTDSFEAQVRDKYGATATVPIRVGVAAHAALNQAPVALDDHLEVRPGRAIAYNVLANDADPDGDPINLSEDLRASEGTDAKVEDGFVSLRVPSVTGAASAQASVHYTISDGLGGSDEAALTVDASADAPLYAPVTVDDVASFADVAGKQPGDVVRVDVLKNDGDLDGRREDLTLAPWDPIVSSVVDGKLQIVLTADDQVVVYKVTDADDNTSLGFVFVSGTDSVVPVLNPDAVPVELKAGEAKEVKLSDVVLVRSGHSPIVYVPDGVTTEPFAGGVEVPSLTKIVVTAPEDFSGAAAVTLQVSDGANANDPDGRISLLSIPLDVTAAVNQPPTLRDVSVEVIGGDNAEVKRIDLSVGAADANADDVANLTYEATSTDKVDASIEDGSWLVLKAKDSAVDLEQSDVPLTVTDPAGAQGTATAHVTVVRSDLPLVSVSKIGPLEGEESKPVTFDINDYAVDPYPDKSLSVSNSVVEVGQGTASAAGSQVTVTPAARFSGSMSVRFVVHDGSGDPQRDVTARAQITVVAAPDAPGRPIISGSTQDTVDLSWQAPDDKGASIDSYTVDWRGGSQDCGPATSCTITGLTPGDSYTFTVKAHNKVDWSQPSPASDQVTPDKVPDQMAAPTINQDYTDRDGKLTLAWSPPTNVGSPINHYEIALLGTTEVRNAGAADRTFVWTGLANGSMQQFRIRAVNKIQEESRKQAWSEPSLPDKAFGLPATMAQPIPSASKNDGAAGGLVSVEWQAPDSNGDDLDHYVVTMTKDGAVQPAKTVDVSSVSTVFNVENGHDYSFTVQAHNRAGLGEDSPVSNTVNPYDKATQVLNLTKVSEGDRTARISFRAPADDGGRPIVGYRITSTGGTDKTVQAAGNTDISFSANNGPYSVTVVPITHDSADGDVTGDSADLGGVRPFGPPNVPAANAVTNGMAVNLSWGPPSPQENGRPLTALEVSIDGGSWQAKSISSGSQNVGNAYSEAHSINVRVTDSEGQTRESGTITAFSMAKPAKWMHIDYVSATSNWIAVTVKYFEPNRKLTVECWVTPNADGTEGTRVASFTMTTDNDGYAFRNDGCNMTGIHYGNLRIGPNELWSNTITLH